MSEIKYYDNDINPVDFKLQLIQIRNSYYSDVYRELIKDLCSYLCEYGSAVAINRMEEKYDFDYMDVMNEIEKNIGGLKDD